MAKIEGIEAAVNVARKLFWVSFMQTTAVIDPKTPPVSSYFGVTRKNCYVLVVGIDQQLVHQSEQLEFLYQICQEASPTQPIALTMHLRALASS